MSTPLLLGAADWPQVIIIIVVAGFSVAAHLIKLATKAKQARPDANGPQPNRPRRPNPDLSDEVEDFLQNVQKRQGNRPQGPRRRPSDPRVGSGRNQPVVAEIVEAQVVSSSAPLASRGTSFGSSTSVSSDAVAAEAERLGQQAQSLGAQIDQNVHRTSDEIQAKFDHQLGQFASQQAASDDATRASSQADADATTDLATELRQMLADPLDVRRAIVVSEILHPPVDRW